MSRSRDLGDVGSKANFLDNVSTDLGDFSGQSIPHIIPGVLYPAYVASGTSPKLLDGTTTHGTGTYNGVAVSTAYGTVQADGRKYYYTNIAGSKPIHKPCGAFFGSQRHKFKSLQLLEQETATHGNNVYSIDGREWLRLSDKTNAWSTINDDYGQHLFWNSITDSNEDFFEIVGYFNGVNLINLNGTTQKSFAIKIDGSVNNSLTDYNSHRTTVDSPLVVERFVDAGGVTNIPISTTLGIHTLRLEMHGSVQYLRTYGIELIAHDTSNVNEIKIPKQNVVSYGKKFEVGSDDLNNAVHPHYNPFNNQTIGDNTSHGKNTSGWTTYDSTLHEASSLGLDAWKDGSNYYRPVNGGRIVRWVDENGNIKTSVNMMPPSAKAIGSHSGNSGPHETAWTSAYQPVFSSGSIDHTQAEVAKTWHWREFGNGSANGGSGTESSPITYQDFSTLNHGTSNDVPVAYVMDDGLTSLSSNDARASGSSGSTNGDFEPNADGNSIYFTFIGTGFSLYRGYNTTFTSVVQNLPYSTHIVKIERDDPNEIIYVDGVSMGSTSLGSYASTQEFTIYQPKKPLIPEQAVILADYCLLADFVKQTGTGSDIRGQISKGVRRVSGSRDVFCDDTGSRAFYSDAQDSVQLEINNPIGFMTFASHSSTQTSSAQLEFFGTDAIVHVQGSDQTHIVDFGGSTNVAKTALDNTSDNKGDVVTLDNSATLGSNTVKTTVKQGGYFFFGYDVTTPIHSSSHYQSFESPLLHELLGGDRNMEQTNLVCSPDGKTWDQLTRDTSYIGNMAVSA